VDALALAGYGATLVLGIVSFLIKRELNRTETDLKEIREEISTKTEKFFEELKERDQKIESVQKEYGEKLTNFHQKIGERIDHFHKEQRDARDSSKHEIDLKDEKLERKTAQLEREFLDFKAQAVEKYVSKVEFIRESTVLETRISNTKKAVEDLDANLSEYLKE